MQPCCRDTDRGIQVNRTRTSRVAFVSRLRGWRASLNAPGSRLRLSGRHGGAGKKGVRRLCGIFGTVALLSGLIVAAPGFVAGSASADTLTTQTISFAPLVARQVGDAPFAVSATASSALPVSFSVTTGSAGVCTSGGAGGATITLVGPGICTVQADQAGNSTYSPAPSVQQAFTVSQATPTITINNIPPTASDLVGSTFTPTFAYSGNGATSVTSSTPATCVVGGTVVYLVAAGTCTLTAHAAATTGDAAATGADQSFAISAPTVPSCTKTWATAVSGNWSDPSKWSPTGVPSSSDNVCITADAASYTVTVDTSANVGSLQVGGAAGTQTLDIPAGTSLALSRNSATSPHGTISMDGGSQPSYLYLQGNTLTNDGTFTVPAETVTAYPAYLDGAGGGVVNNGTVHVDGSLNTSSYGATFTNEPAGTVADGGSFAAGTYVQAGGSNTGAPLSPSTLVLSGGGSASFAAESMTVQGGPLLAGQSIDVPAGGSMSLGSALTNDGTISMEGGSQPSYLYLQGNTLTNAGTFTVPAETVTAYPAYLVGPGGGVVNNGTVQIDGSLNTSSYGATFTNGSGGTVADGGSFAAGTYVQAGGSNTGAPLSPSTLVLSGGGSASFTAESMTVQGGPLLAGQSIDVPAGGSMSLGSALTNDGTISMEGGSQPSYLYLQGNTLTNAGTFTVPAETVTAYRAYLVGPGGGVVNNGTVQVDGSLNSNSYGGTVTNNASFTIGSAGSFTNGTFTNGSGGTVADGGSFAAGTYVQAGGSNTGAPLSPSTLVLSGGGSASFTAESMTVQGGPLLAGQSIDVPAGGSMSLGSALTNDGTISMEGGSQPSYLYLQGNTLTNAGTFTVPAETVTAYPAYLVGPGGGVVNNGTVQVDGSLNSNSYGGTVTNNASVTIGSAGSFTNGTFVQSSSGVMTFVHDATGASGSLRGGSVSLAGCVGASGPSLPTLTTLNVLSYSTLTGQFSCTTFPTQIFSVIYNTAQSSVQLVASDLVATPPAITSAGQASFTAGTPGSFTVTSTGPPAPGLTETGALPAGVTFVDNGDGTATLSGTPAAGSGGVYALTFTAANGATPSAQQSFTLTVDATPSVTSADNATFMLGAAGSFTVTASGFPTPAFTVGSGLPAGVTFVDNGNGTATLSGTPAAGTGGFYPLTFTASNGVATAAQQAFTLKVNRPPTVSVDVTPGATTVGDQVAAVITASDPDGDPLTYSVQFGDGSTASVGAYPGSPVTIDHTYLQPGPWTVLAEATDDSGATTQASQVIEVDPGQALSANAGPDQTTTANEPAGQGITLDGSASTPACCIASYQWQVTNGSDTQGFSTKVVNDVHFATPGTYTATLTVQSGSNTSSDSATITVDPQVATGVTVTVLDDANSSPIDGAQVVVISAAGEQYQGYTNATGLARLTGVPDGSYTAYVVDNGYSPNQGSLTVSGGVASATVLLTAGGLALDQPDLKARD